MGIINFGALKDKEAFEGEACIQTMSLAKTKNGKDYLSGNFRIDKNTYRYNIWDSSVIADFKPILDNFALPALVHISGEASSFNGDITFSIRAGNVIQETDTMNIAMFMPTLDCEKLFTDFCNFVNENLSPAYLNVLIAIMKLPVTVFTGTQAMEKTKTIQDLFKTNWAASGMHDAIGGGLLSHTLKMLRLGKTLLEDHPTFAPYKDVILLGIAIHDIGKVQEIVNGVYSHNSYVTHLVMGCEYLAMIKPIVVEQIGIDNYSRLLSILIGHHDKFGTPASTVYAYIVHMIDMLESQTTIFDEALAQNTTTVEANGEKTIKYDGRRLYY